MGRGALRVRGIEYCQAIGRDMLSAGDDFIGLFEIGG